MAARTLTARERSSLSIELREKVRLRDPATGELLHLSGRGTTRNVIWSWLGDRRQARALRERAAIRGEPWPYVTVRRETAEPKQEQAYV